MEPDKEKALIFHSIYALPLQTVIAVMIFVLIVWTTISIRIQTNRKPWHVFNGILTIISLIAILYLTLVNRSAQEPQIPFIRTIDHIRQQPELIREMVMNAFLFFPFGLCLPYALEVLPRVKNMKPVFIAIVSAMLLSGLIELTQYLSSFGNCELSDIVMNTLGAAIGSVSYLVSQKVISKKICS